MAFEVKHEKNLKRFALYDDGKEVGELTYTDRPNGVRSADHTIVLSSYSGQGLAGKLFDALVENAREEHIKILPICAYVKGKFDADPEKYKDIRA